MNTITFLEKLANDVHYSDNMDKLISIQSSKVQNAFLANDGDSLKKQLSNAERFADNVAVVCVVG